LRAPLLCRWGGPLEAVAIDRLPRRGPLLMVANRAGTLLPYEAFMLVRAFATSPPEARAAHPLLDDWLLRLPLLGGAVAALGAVSASPAALRRILRSGDGAITFPERPD